MFVQDLKAKESVWNFDYLVLDALNSGASFRRVNAESPVYKWVKGLDKGRRVFEAIIQDKVRY